MSVPTGLWREPPGMTGVGTTAAGSLELAITRAVASTLDVPIEEVTPRKRLTSLGMDSLSSVELVLAIEASVGVSLGLDSVWVHPGVESLAHHVRGRLGNGANGFSGASEYVEPVTAGSPLLGDCGNAGVLRMLKDAVLPDDLGSLLEGGGGRRPTPAAQGEAVSVFLIGATGFVGAYLLSELLKEPDVRVHCLVRSEDSHQGLRRIQTNLERHDAWDPGFARRIRVVRGDLTQPCLGLEP